MFLEKSGQCGGFLLFFHESVPGSIIGKEQLVNFIKRLVLNMGITTMWFLIEIA